METYFITDMQHGTPIDPGPGEDQCGTTAPFILDADICSSYHIARFWGLDITDKKAPQVSIISPADGAQVSNEITIEARATDNVEVTKRAVMSFQSRPSMAQTMSAWMTIPR